MGQYQEDGKGKADVFANVIKFTSRVYRQQLDGRT